MTDTVSKHLSAIHEGLSSGRALDFTFVLTTTDYRDTFDKTLGLLNVVAKREGFDQFTDVAKSCGRDLCVKFIEKVEEYYEETIQHQYNAGPFRQPTATPQQG